jgi:hypothetical protein
MIKKEIVAHIETNEEGEFIKVNALDTDPGFFLLSLGQNRLVINGQELIEALHTIDQYAAMFAQERLMKQQRAKAPPKAMVVETVPVKKAKRNKEDEEGTIVLDPILRLGPTASELALEAQTKHMKGETLVLTDKK